MVRAILKLKLVVTLFALFLLPGSMKARSLARQLFNGSLGGPVGEQEGQPASIISGPHLGPCSSIRRPS